MAARSRQVVFTLNNYTSDEERDMFEAFSSLSNNIRFCGVGREIGESGTPHFQGFIYFDNPKTFSAAHKIPGLNRAHFEPVKGTIQQNIDYCSKGGDYKEYGEKPTQGKRNDLEEVAELVKAGKRISDVAFECPTQFIKFHKGIERLISLQIAPRDFKTMVYWYYGPTGTGKSKKAFEQAAEAASYYVKDPLNKWYCGYEQQELMIIDDYRRDFSTFACLLRLMDRYPMTVETKGGTTQFVTRTLVITTPKSPTETWEGRTEEELGQLLRRIDHCVHFATLANNM